MREARRRVVAPGGLTVRSPAWDSFGTAFRHSNVLGRNWFGSVSLASKRSNSPSLLRDEGVAGSNPATPTIRQTPPRRPGVDVRQWRCGASRYAFVSPARHDAASHRLTAGFGSLGHDFLPGRREERGDADEPSRRSPGGPGAVGFDCRRRDRRSGAPADRARDGMACAVPDRVRRAPAPVGHPDAAGGAEPVPGPSHRADPVASEPCRLDGHAELHSAPAALLSGARASFRRPRTFGSDPAPCQRRDVGGRALPRAARRLAAVSDRRGTRRLRAHGGGVPEGSGDRRHDQQRQPGDARRGAGLCRIGGSPWRRGPPRRRAGVGGMVEAHGDRRARSGDAGLAVDRMA
jgi:hypothetical protein